MNEFNYLLPKSMDSSSSSGSTTSAARTALRPETSADRRRMMPVLGDIVKTLPGCGENDAGWNWSEVSVDRVGVIIEGPSSAGWVKLRWEDGSESGRIGTYDFLTPTGPSPSFLMNLSGQERMLIAAARVSASVSDAALESALAQLRAEHSEASEALAAVRGVDTEVVEGQQDGIIGDHQADIAGEDS